jgi:hypothetical protein
MADRQRIIENNRSLRTIKNELENLLEKGVISGEVFDAISVQLPAESPLSGASASSTPVPLPLPPRNNSHINHTVSAAASAFNALNVSGPANPPPAYSQTPPPALPARNPVAAPAPEKPVLAHVRALYKYDAADVRDVALERDDRIAVYDYVNDQWWMGRNLRTGAEGIFPKTYVLVEEDRQKPMPPPVPSSSMNGVSTATLGNVHGGPPPQQAAYDPNEGKPSKMEENGKKFGKKLGNAAIFGAGATIGSKIVNGIF